MEYIPLVWNVRLRVQICVLTLKYELHTTIFRIGRHTHTERKREYGYKVEKHWQKHLRLHKCLLCSHNRCKLFKPSTRFIHTLPRFDSYSYFRLKITYTNTKSHAYSRRAHRICISQVSYTILACRNPFRSPTHRTAPHFNREWVVCWRTFTYHTVSVWIMS